MDARRQALPPIGTFYRLHARFSILCTNGAFETYTARPYRDRTSAARRRAPSSLAGVTKPGMDPVASTAGCIHSYIPKYRYNLAKGTEI
eukprot:SAG31_NODE_98_length_25640_cov_9.936744_4_plen_89_part_00